MTPPTACQYVSLSTAPLAGRCKAPKLLPIMPCRFPDAPHGVSADGGASGGNSRGVSDTGAAEWDAQQPQVLLLCTLDVPLAMLCETSTIQANLLPDS